MVLDWPRPCSGLLLYAGGVLGCVCCALAAAKQGVHTRRHRRPDGLRGPDGALRVEQHRRKRGGVSVACVFLSGSLHNRLQLCICEVSSRAFEGSVLAGSHRHIFSQSAGPKVTSWANWWMAKDKVVELKHLRDVDALTHFEVAKDHLTNAAAAVDRSEDQMRQLLAAETALTQARQKLLKWESFTRQEQTTLFPHLVECHHLLICTTYWVASDLGLNPQAGLKRSWVIIERLMKLVSDKETQALEDAERARNGFGFASFLEARAETALKPVQGLYETNILPYVDQLEKLKGTRVLHSIAWRSDRATGHMCEALVQWDAAGKAEIMGGGAGSAVQSVADAAGSSATIGAVARQGQECPQTGQVAGGAAAMIADTLGGTAGLEPEPELGREAASEPALGPESASVSKQPVRCESSTLEEKLQHCLDTFRFFLEIGQDTGQIEADIAGIRGEIAKRAEDFAISLEETKGELERIRQEVAAALAAKEKAERARGRACDPNAKWLWASGRPDGSDGVWKPYEQHTVKRLESCWADGDAECSIFPRATESSQGLEYIVDLTTMIQRQVANPMLQRKVVRHGALLDSLAATAEAVAEGIPPG